MNLRNKHQLVTGIVGYACFSQRFLLELGESLRCFVVLACELKSLCEVVEILRVRRRVVSLAGRVALLPRIASAECEVKRWSGIPSWLLSTSISSNTFGSKGK
jgi:hypothetical protein